MNKDFKGSGRGLNLVNALEWTDVYYTRRRMTWPVQFIVAGESVVR